MFVSLRPAGARWPRATAYFFCLTVSLWLSACSVLNGPVPLPPRPERAAVAAFSLEGRLAVRQGDGPASAGIEWQHQAGLDHVFLTGPLGQGLAELEQTPQGARMTTADRKTFTAPDATTLCLRLLGFELPLDALPQVVVGQVTPLTQDALGRPDRALSNGWRVHYLRYESDDSHALPSLIELQRDASGDQEALELRLKIDQWQVHE